MMQQLSDLKIDKLFKELKIPTVTTESAFLREVTSKAAMAFQFAIMVQSQGQFAITNQLW